MSLEGKPVGVNSGNNDVDYDEVDDNLHMGGMASVLRDISSGSNLRRLSPKVSEEIKILAPNQKISELEAENRSVTHLNTSLQTLNDELYVKNERIIIELTTLKGENNQLMLDNEKKDTKLSLLRSNLKDRISEIEYKRKHIESITIDNESLSTRYQDIKRSCETSKNGVDMNMIESKCEVYYNLFIRLYDKLTITKKRLDLYQNYLKYINSAIQLSVITLSISSSFIQALDSKTYEIFFNTGDSINSFNNTITDNKITTYGSGIEESSYSSAVSIATLSISTYSALVIAAERHFSFQQRETNVEKLKESYAEPINRIKNNLELIRPWRYKGYYMKTKDKCSIDKSSLDLCDEPDNVEVDTLIFDQERKKEWITMVDKLDREYSHIVDVKKELDTSLDKMISVKTIKSYQDSAPRKKREIGLHNINTMENHANNTNFMHSWWKCKRRVVNHTYDEEDINNIEDKAEIDQLNNEHISRHRIINA